MTNTNKRITKAMRNEDIIAMLKILQNNADCLTIAPTSLPHGTTIEEAITHLTYENELLARKNSGDNKKLTKTQAENVKHKENIIAFLATVDKGVTATEVMNACNLPSNQKAAALLRALMDAGEVNRAKEKGGKIVFTLSNGDNDTTEE